jgi:predicted Zn-dependent protease
LGQTVEGRDGWRRYRDMIRSGSADFHNQVVDLVVSGERAAARLEYSGTHTGPLLGISHTGRRFNYSGAWSSGVTERYLVTTANRNEAWHLGTDQYFTCVLKHPQKRWELRAVGTGWRADEVAVDRAVEDLSALVPVYDRQDAMQLEPGPYTVVLGAEALAEILAMAVWTGLTGRGWEEKQGWTSGNQLGDEVLGGNVSLLDDPSSEQTFRHGFDDSGQLRSVFPLLENGRLAGLMYDPQTAARYGKAPTGHNLESGSMVMPGGDGPDDPLAAVGSLGSVLYIPALHYMHVPNRSQGIFTGSSRFNAVLLDGGRVVRPIYSSRITDSFANVFGQVRTLARKTVSVNQSNTYGRRAPVASSVPAYAVVEGVKITDSAEAF